MPTADTPAPRPPSADPTPRLSPRMRAVLARAISPHPSARSWRDEGEVATTDPTLRALVARGLVERPSYTYGDRRKYATGRITDAGRAAIADGGQS